MPWGTLTCNAETGIRLKANSQKPSTWIRSLPRHTIISARSYCSGNERKRLHRNSVNLLHLTRISSLHVRLWTLSSNLTIRSLQSFAC